MAPDAGGWTIGELSRRSGVPVTTLRYYDGIGLVVPVRLENGHRRYASSVLVDLRLVQLCRALGCSLTEVADVLDPDNRPARVVIARRKLSELDGRIGQLQAARAILAHMAQCKHASTRQCREETLAEWTAAAGEGSDTGRARSPVAAAGARRQRR